MKVGFTATQEGMTQRQRYSLEDLLDELHAMELHHGDCIGGDEEAHIIALTIGIDVVIHPPDDDSKRAFCKLATEVREPKPYLVRNDDIAEEGEVLIAAPKEYKEKVRSGTWATVRYARKKGRTIFIILPDGRVILG